MALKFEVNSENGLEAFLRDSRVLAHVFVHFPENFGVLRAQSPHKLDVMRDHNQLELVLIFSRLYDFFESSG